MSEEAFGRPSEPARARPQWVSGPEPPPPQHNPIAAEPVLVTVGDIGCTATRVMTPSGQQPLAGTTWIVTDQTSVSQRIPSYAIVLAVLLMVFCLLGLLFLAVKEEKIQGFVQVSVQREGFYYATQVKITDRAQVFDTERRVNYIRSLVAALPAV
ncbi:hypothetical protein DFR70_10175 [Nocardia tenerifensis]|uniref:Uncharacterized protein n=1 Tax=Nocardia tenerifensis TaxID=228006 RepID=A0A318K996_9NOCA|nr:hypothetical protein [Nocardia tenerifensis]PXX70656.1 hypothetical protein DFR70_10175 [Nocardia tenerifensis]